MDEVVWRQAKFLYETITFMRLRIMPRHLEMMTQGGAAPVELTMPQMTTLLVVNQYGPFTIRELAEAMQVSAPSASSMVDRLVEQELLSREHSRTDRREVVVALTEKGRKLLEIAERSLLQSFVELLEQVGPECAQQWCAVYRRVRDVLEGQGDAAAARPTVDEEALGTERGGTT